MARNRALGSPFQVETVSDSFDADRGVDMYAINAEVGTPVTATLNPYAAGGDQVVIQDVANNAGTQPITVVPGDGQTILSGFGSSLSLSTNGAGVLLTFIKELNGWVPELFGGGGGGTPTTPGLNIVRVNTGGTGGAQASPYTAKAFDWVICDASAGPIVVNLPALTSGQWVSVAQDGGTAFNDTITINPASGDLDQPVPNNGTFVSSLVFGPGTRWTPPDAVDMRVQYYNGGSPGGLLLE